MGFRSRLCCDDVRRPSSSYKRERERSVWDELDSLRHEENHLETVGDLKHRVHYAGSLI